MHYAGKSSDNVIIILSFYLAAAYRLVPSINKIFVSYQQIKFGKPSQPLINEYYNLETPPEQWTNKCISNRILI